MSDPTDDSADFLAYWWLPDHPERHVPGRLTWDHVSGGDLQLMGELREPVILDNPLVDGSVQKYRPRPNRSDSRYPVIHGKRILASGREEAYTLLHSLSLNNVGFLDVTEYPEHITAGAVLRGAWYTEPADIEADRAVFHIRHLSTWVAATGLETTFPALGGDSSAPFAIIHSQRQPPYATTHDGAVVELRQQFEHTGDQERASGIQQSWRLVIRIEPMGELERFTDIATDIRALVTIAAGKTADIERAVLQHPNLHEYRLDGTPMPTFRQDINYLGRWVHRGTDTGIIHRHELYFTLEDFGGADGIQRWLGASQTYRTELQRVMATRYTNTMYLEDRIMNTCAALERIDKVRRPNAPKVQRDNKLVDSGFVDRIEACIDYAGPDFEQLIVEDLKEWACRVRDKRNGLAHHDDPFRVSGDLDEYLLAEQTYWLFALCMLRASDAPQTTFDSISKHGQVRWLRQQAQERAAPQPDR